jgi:hypothetical protein
MKKVMITVQVAISPDGSWCAFGSHDSDDRIHLPEIDRASAIDGLNRDEYSVRTLQALAPVPENVTLTAQMLPQSEGAN